jgi:hypothetical protein
MAATTMRTSNRLKTMHDGPFAETEEQLGGLYFIEADGDTDWRAELCRGAAV